MLTFLNYVYHIEVNNCIKSGDYLLYRNELLIDSLGNKYFKYSHSNATDSESIYVGTTPPVAYGITAFFYGGSDKYTGLYIRLLRDLFLDSDQCYQRYYDVVSVKAFKENNRNPIKNDPSIIEYSFLNNHISNETKLFNQSSLFYEELNDNLNFEIKQQLKNYFNGYIQWLEQKKLHLIEMYPQILNLTGKVNSGSQKQNAFHPLQPYKELIDTDFIKTTEFFLKFINIMLHSQFSPNSEFLKENGSLYPFEEGTVLSFFLKIDPDILDFVLFERRIMNMLLNGAKSENLVLVLNKTYSLANDISKFPDDKISLSATNGFYIEFDHVNLIFEIQNSVPAEPVYHHYFNFDFVRYAIGIKNILEDKLGMSEKEISNNLSDTFKVEPINREITSYFNKIESFLIFIKEIFELQLNPDSNYPRAADLFIVENRNAQFEFNISQCAQLYDLELFKNTIGEMMLKNPDSKKGLKTILRNHYEVADQITQIYNHKIDVTTWDRIEHINVKCFGSNVVCEHEAHPAYDEDNIQKTNRDLAIFAEQMFKYLERTLFRDKSKKATISKPEKQIGNNKETKSHPIIENVEVSVKSNNEIIDEFLILVQDNEAYLDFIHFKLYMYESCEKYNDLVGGSVILPKGYSESHEIKAAAIVLDLDFFIFKTREIKYKGIMPESTFYPMMQSLLDKSFKILNANPQPVEHEMFKLIFIRPERRDKISVRSNKDDYNYDNITLSNDNFLLDFCKRLNDFLVKEIPNLQLPVLENPEPSSLTNIWTGSIDQYELVISILTTVNIQVSETAFVQKISEELTWQYPAKYGRDQYLKGFLYTCLKNKLITNQTARKFAQILSTTFNIKCKDDAFKSIISNPPDDKYLIPFKSFPINL